jgi:2-methylcitrate dehydratase
LFHPLTRRLMERIEIRHGGPEYDRRYPDGIPTSLEIDHQTLGTLSSGLVMYPEGHARNHSGRLDTLLEHKFRLLAELGVADVRDLYLRMTNLGEKTADQIATLYDFELLPTHDFQLPASSSNAGGH